MANVVAIVGRPNVGKSTLFNRFVESREAIVDATSGVTRDRHYGESVWNGIQFWVVDTGGYVVGSEDIFEEAIRKQVEFAIEEANIILFLVDVVEGITPLDEDVAKYLRRNTKKKIILVANKVDNTSRHYDTGEFFKLGLGEVFAVSSINGSGTGDLLDELVKYFNPSEVIVDEELPKIAIVGRPNVGKSTFVNTLLDEERNIVTPIAGTTRDTIFTEYNKFGLHFLLMDTAGLRKKGKVYENIEFYSVMRAIKTIEYSDVCILMLDAQQGIESQDINIFSLITKNGKGVVILVNKWDLVEKNSNTHLEYERNIKQKLAPFSDVPIIFISAIEKQRIYKAVQTALDIHKNRSQKISTSELNEKFLPIILNYSPPASRGRQIKIKYITQLKTYNPTFVFFCNYPEAIKEPYKRFLENKLREMYNFTGIPIKIFFRSK